MVCQETKVTGVWKRNGGAYWGNLYGNVSAVILMKGYHELTILENWGGQFLQNRTIRKIHSDWNISHAVCAIAIILRW